MATSGKGQGLSTKKIVLFLGLFCLGSALAFTALGTWIWSSWTDGGGDTAVPVTAQRVDPSATDQPQGAAEVPEGEPGKTEPTKAAKRKSTLAESEPSSEAAASPRRVKRETRAAAKQPAKKVAKERTKKTASEPTKRATEVKPTKRGEVERMPKPVFDGRSPFAGLPGVGGTSLEFPSLEGFPGMAGSLEVRVVGGTGWTFGISGRGTRRTGRAFSKLPPGPMEVEIFDASGHKRGDATVLVMPGETSECTWRVEGETLRFVGGDPCTKL
jgi:hypothetical protein